LISRRSRASPISKESAKLSRVRALRETLIKRLPLIVGERVALRRFRATDVGLVVSVADDPIVPRVTTVPTSGRHDDALAFIERQHDRLTVGIGYSFAIAHAATDEALGQIGLWLQDHGRASVGYWVAARHRRLGYAVEALRMLSKWGLTLDGIERLELYAEPGNQASWRTAERAGFKREGLLRSWREISAKRRDMYMYSLIPADLSP
jgi:[ribosomal protein S5]-alanine N-acetyltransferase